MKKYIIGGIAGFILATAVSAQAAEIASLVGKAIDGAFPVKIDGKTLDRQAIVVEGSSYLPVRVFGEAMGYEVTFDADMGITLTKKGTASPQQPQSSSPASPAAAPSDVKAGYKPISAVTFNIGDKEKSKTFRGAFSYIQVDGTQYVSLITLSGFYTVSWKDPLFEFSLDGSKVSSFPIGTAYTIGTAAFSYDGTPYINLSTLGLKAIVSGDTLAVTEQF